MILTTKDKLGRNHRIVIDDKLSWVAPYVKKAKQLGVPIWRIKKIKGYHVPENKTEQQLAQITRYGNGKFVITMLEKVQLFESIGDGKLKVSGHQCALEDYRFEDTLRCLAHEVAHVEFWLHCQDRLILEAKLYLAFARKAKQLGYKGFK